MRLGRGLNEATPCWFEAVQLFDLCSSTLAQSSIAGLMARACAAWVLVVKICLGDLAMLSPEWLDDLIVLASHTSLALGGETVSFREVLAQERALIVDEASGSSLVNSRTWLEKYWDLISYSTEVSLPVSFA